ncbi:MAG: biotin--[acetyl-CoA-carboxylase] ligase [Beutenbergiaceae bacterium]
MSEPALPPIKVVARTASTQTDLLTQVSDEAAWPHLSGIRAVEQTGGRGRGQRRWDTRTMRAMTASLVLRPAMAQSRWSWLPLLAGVSVVQVLTELGAPAAMKWPNDVVVPADSPVPGWGPLRKVAGIRMDVVPESAVVLGIGINLAGTVPVPWAGTLDQVVSQVPDAAMLLEQIRIQLDALLALPWHAQVSGVTEHCLTLGSTVQVQTPGGREFTGLAEGLDPAGGLQVRRRDGQLEVVLAGDISHVRTPTPLAE